MANLSIRKLDDEVFEQLRIRAVRNGVSMEEEVRRIITTAVSAPDQLGDFFVGLFGREHGVDLELPAQPLHEPIEITD